MTAMFNFSGRPRLPVMQSAEASECGLACIAMIAAYHGSDVDMNGMRQRFALSLAGATLRGLMGLADKLGFSSRALRAEVEGLRHVTLPAILHWDLNHFVVLAAAGKDGFTVHDPMKGRAIYSAAELSRRFTGVVLELTPTTEFKPVVAKAPIRISSLWSKITGLRRAAWQVLALSISLQLIAFALPFQVQLAVDEAITRSDKGLIFVIALGFGALIILQSLIEALRSWTLQLLGYMLSFQAIGNVVRHLIRLPSSYFEKRHVGDIMSRLHSVSAIQDFLTRGIVASVLDSVVAIGAVIILLTYSPVLTGVVCAAVILNLVASLAVFPRLRAKTDEEISSRAKEQSHLMETVRAATVVKLMGREVEREAAWRNLFSTATGNALALSRQNIVLSAFQSAVTGLQTVVVVYFASKMIIDGQGFSIGMLFAFLSFRQMFTDRANSLVSQFMQFKFLSLHLDRLADIVSTPLEEETEDYRLSEVHGGVSFRGVRFRYGATDRDVIDGMDFDIKPGEFVAFTGPSGGGKTTLLKLILGIHRPTEGLLKLDGYDASPSVSRAWRSHVGIVSQDDRLLSGSIADNIAFFDPDIDMHRVVRAAVQARVHDDIAKMPMAYLSSVGDMGAALSGGQKQRVLLARALYRDPSVLILDEGTANLDLETEEQIGDLISGLPMTRIVIAHRPNLLQRADKVFTVRDGRVFGAAGWSVANGKPTAIDVVGGGL
ncbi:peptidase domain-containing ABC transporter [Caulobacter segnis]